MASHFKQRLGLAGCAASAVGLGALVMISGAMAQDICAATEITAHGEGASFEWLAKTKARANWRSRVRATKGLGPLYDSWSRASDRTEECTQTPTGVVCSIVGKPCQR